MITYRKAKELIFPGEFVYIISDGLIEALEVIRVNASSLQVKDGFLDFEDHGQTWWLTKTVAEENLENFVPVLRIRRKNGETEKEA